ncbi:MAG: DUF4040 domain-containing protein [Vallitaleaceae bacterium]|jgi:putative multicomponent Na+:H+ antiporter subunit B|nr:DUF4040 domain-containing protein [Vallitaleaceae bacterium]
MQYVILIMMVIFAIAAIQTEVLRRTIIYAGVFSLLSSFAYLLYKAPDVAIAEAVIGCTLATVIYLVAMTKYKVFRVYYKHTSTNKENIHDILESITKYTDYMSLQLDTISTKKDLHEILEDSHYDVIIIQNDTSIDVYGETSNYHFDSMIDFLNLTCRYKIDFHFVTPKKLEDNYE